MSVARIASRYAKSLIDLAVDQNKLDRVKEDIDLFREIVKNRDFHRLLKSPIISIDKKAQVCKTLLEGKMDELTMAFLNILITKGREAYLPEIALEFIIQYKKINHITSVKITTAAPLSDELLETVKTKLKESGQTDDKVEITQTIDTTLIGGFIVEFDGKVYDTSLSHKLEKMRKEFDENLYISQIIAG